MKILANVRTLILTLTLRSYFILLYLVIMPNIALEVKLLSRV